MDFEWPFLKPERFATKEYKDQKGGNGEPKKANLEIRKSGKARAFVPDFVSSRLVLRELP